MTNQTESRHHDNADAPRPARIALMLPRFSRYGGVEQYGYALAEAFAAKGYAVDFICARQEAEAPQGVRVIAVGRPPGLKVLKMLWFLIQAERARKAGNYDLSISLGKTWNQDIVREGGGPLQVFWRLSREAWDKGLPRLLKTATRLLQPANWLTLFIEKRLFRQTPYVVAISHSVRAWVAEAYPHFDDPRNDRQQLLTIYNCPDLSRFHPPLPDERAHARADLGMKPETYALGVATTNFALKGVGPLIRSLLLLPADTHLYIAGGRNPKAYRKLAESAGLASRVHFLGKVSDMQAFYHGLDMFVLPSFYDTLGNVVLEALACGLKTLCSNRAGASAFLPPERIIAEPGDSGEIARRIQDLRASEEPIVFTPRGTGVGELIALAEEVLKKKRLSEMAAHSAAPWRQE